MTTTEIVLTIQMLLDDQAWLPYLTAKNPLFLDDMINIAQIKTIEKYYAMQDERALRPLYIIESVFDGSLLNFNVMYPRALILFKIVDSSNQIPFSSRYEQNDAYNNYILQFGTVAGVPKTSIYTINQTINATLVRDIINFNDSTGGDFYYIRKPALFSNSIRFNVQLSLPPEYHFEVCALTAELINDIDVNEQERGEPVYQNQRLNLKDTL